MVTLLLSVLMLVGGIIILVVGANLLISGAVAIAVRFGVSPLLVGLTIVAWGTSAPELAFNVVAAVQDKTGLVIGNTVGANICNLALILGVCAVFRPLVVHDTIIRVELPVVFGLCAVLGALAILPELAAPGSMSRMDGLILLIAFSAYSAAAMRAAIRSHGKHTSLTQEMTKEELPSTPMKHSRAIVMVVIGLVMLSGGGALSAEGATGLALAAGFSERVVAVTIVSLGTTLPELVTAVLAVRRKHVDLAVGNVVGSCLFNAGVILPVATIISPASLPEGSLISIGVLIAVALIMQPIARTHNRRIARFEGVILLAAYAAYIVFELASR